MTKEKYLEDLYQELQKYEADSVLKHVTEYDYLISDMLDDATMEEVIEKLGSSTELASNIAEEFDYELKKTNQFEDPIISRKKDYSSRHDYSVFAKIINVGFLIVSIFFFFSYIVSIIGLLVFILIFGLVSLSTMIWLLLALIAFSVFVLALYMIVLNAKNLVVSRMFGNESEVK